MRQPCSLSGQLAGLRAPCGASAMHPPPCTPAARFGRSAGAAPHAHPRHATAAVSLARSTQFDMALSGTIPSSIGLLTRLDNVYAPPPLPRPLRPVAVGASDALHALIPRRAACPSARASARPQANLRESAHRHPPVRAGPADGAGSAVRAATRAAAADAPSPTNHGASAAPLPPPGPERSVPSHSPVPTTRAHQCRQIRTPKPAGGLNFHRARSAQNHLRPHNTLVRARARAQTAASRARAPPLLPLRVHARTACCCTTLERCTSLLDCRCRACGTDLTRSLAST